MCDHGCIQNFNEVAHVVVLGVHLHHNHLFGLGDEEAVSEVKSDPTFQSIVDDYLLIVRLVILPVLMSLNQGVLEAR